MRNFGILNVCTPESVVATVASQSSVDGALVPLFRSAILNNDDFRTSAICIDGSPPVYAHFVRVAPTAATVAWMRSPASDIASILLTGFEAFSLLLSGVSAGDDEEVIRSSGAFMMTTPSNLRMYQGKIAQVLEEFIRGAARPLAVNVQMQSEGSLNGSIIGASTALASAFFESLGVGLLEK